MRFFAFLAALLVCGALALGSRSCPDPSSPDAPARLHVSPRFLERSGAESGRSEPVPAILWDYRSVDAWGLVFAAFGAVVVFAAVARGLGRTFLSQPEFAEEESEFTAAAAAAAAWCLGVLPAFRGGNFLDVEKLPQWVGPEHLRAAASWAWEASAVIVLLCAGLILARILKRGRTRP